MHRFARVGLLLLAMALIVSILPLLAPPEDRVEAQVIIITLDQPTATRTPTPINVGNFVWDDLDSDGRQDAGEPGLSGVTVQLWNSTKTNLIDQTTTNASGIYTLIAPTPGDYRVRVVLQNINDQFSPKDNAAAGDQQDSDINPSGSNLGFTDIYTFGSNLISITTIDAGIIRFRTPTPTRTPTPINVGNFVWNDLDGDGRQDAGEPGLGGVVVQLWNSTKTNLIDQTTTNANGNYALTAPTPGDYRVRVVLPVAGDQFSPKDNAAAGDQQDSDINPSGGNLGFTDIYTFASNLISITSIDAGLSEVNPTATFTASPTASNTPTPTDTLTATNTPTSTDTVTPSNTPTSTDTVTPSNTPTSTDTVTPSNTPTSTNTLDPSITPTLTFTPSNTPTSTDTVTPSNTPTSTNTLDPSITPTLTFTPSNTPTSTNTLDPSITPTLTFTPSNTPTATNTIDPSVTATATETDDFLIFTDTPTPTSTIDPVEAAAAYPTPPGTPRCDLRNAEPSDIVRAGVRQEFDLFCRTLIQWGDFVYYAGGALTGFEDVGIEGLIRLGMIQAVDIFSPSGQRYFTGGYVACLAGTGTLIWLDANNAPRRADIIGSYTIPDWPGFTCATLFTPGTLVLVNQMN